MIHKCSPTLAIATLSLAMFDIRAAQAASQTLEKIKEVGKITFGYREASIPFAYLGADQKPTGLSLELCSAVADKIRFEFRRPGLETEYVAVDASNRIPLLQNGTIDVECGSTTNTAERQKQVSFSIATYVASPRWLVSASSPVTELDGLEGQTIVVTQGSLNLTVAKKVIADQKLNATIVQAKDHAESILMLRTGRATAWFEDDILVAGLVSRSQGLPDAGGDLRADVLRAHDSEGGSGVQSARRFRDQGEDGIGRIQQTLHEMVRVAHSPEGTEPAAAHERCDEGSRRISQRCAHSVDSWRRRL